MIDYRIKFEVFEGPLDLLLYLVRRQEVDISQISIAKLASDFLEYLQLMQELDLDVAGEFIVMAATLLYLKSRELLPVEQRVGIDEEEDEDPRWNLIRRLLEFKRYKELSEKLRELESKHAFRYPHPIGRIHPSADQLPARLEASLFDLIGALHRIVRRVQARKVSVTIEREIWTVASQMRYLLTHLNGIKEPITFSAFFGALPTRQAIIVTFLALLELIRIGRLRAYQYEPFGEIYIVVIEPRTIGKSDLPAQQGQIDMVASS